MSDLRNVSSNPHIRAKDTTSRIMLTVVIALLLPAFFGIYNFGFRALVLILISIATCVLTEYIYEKLMKKPITIGDFSAVVTGLLLALNLPVSVPFWIPVVGGVFAILVVKMLFGGLGQNFMNPALGARCFLLISFAGPMTKFVYDGVSGPTPLATLKDGGSVDSMKMLIGTIPGTIGETSVIAIIIGAVFLIMLGIIDLRIPGTYIVSFVIFVGIFGPFTKDEVAKFEPTACINCGRCVDACPSRLIPSRLADYAEHHDEETFTKHNGLECMECGSCSFVCPAKRQLKQAIGSMRKIALANRKKKK